MLILTRKCGESIVIDSKINLMVTGFSPAGTQLMISQPDHPAREVRLQEGHACAITTDVCVQIFNARRGQIRLGFNAPRHIAIDRKEIYLRKQAAAA